MRYQLEVVKPEVSHQSAIDVIAMLSAEIRRLQKSEMSLKDEVQTLRHRLWLATRIRGSHEQGK